MSIDLCIGDASVAKKFTKVMRGGGRQISADFKPNPGKEFVVLLVGEVDAGAESADVDGMLRVLGYVPAEASKGGDAP